MKVSVILPTYNEKDNVLALVGELHTCLKDHDHEILVVDDNSPDGTYQALKERQQSFVRPILRTKDRGFAKSIRCGLENAKGDVLIIMDSDFNHQPKYVPIMIENIKYYDCVSPSRFVYGGAMGSRLRHVLSWQFNIFIRVMTGGAITDSLYGFCAIRKDVIEKCNYDDIFWGYGDYYVRLLYYLQKQKADVLQIPVVNGERMSGTGNRNFIGTFFKYLKEVILLTFKGRILGQSQWKK